MNHWKFTVVYKTALQDNYNSFKIIFSIQEKEQAKPQSAQEPCYFFLAKNSNRVTMCA